MIRLRDATQAMAEKVKHTAQYGEELFRLLVESVEEYAIFAMDTDGRIVHWNTGAQRITGYQAAEAVGKPLHEIFTPEDIAAGVPEQELMTALQVGRAADERWHMRKDGSRFWGLGAVVPLRRANGALCGFGKILHDRTDLKQLQEALQNEARVLTQADEQKNRFIAILAHELRNPQSVLMNSAAFIQRHQQEYPKLQQLAEMVERQVRHMQRLVDDLTDITRISHGKVRLHRRVLDLREVAARSVETVRPLVEERNHTLSVQQCLTPVEVEGDDDRLQQVLVNLLANSARYTDPGGRIALTVDTEGEEAVARIYDTGTGIPPEQLESIFELFSQAHAQRAGTSAGLGIGLALARELVTLHGGTIQARSEGHGKGSEFIVRLPLHKPAAGRRPEKACAQSGK